MIENEKRAAALRLMAGTKIWRCHYAPPLYRWLWKFDIAVPPPHFASFWLNFAVTGGYYGSVIFLIFIPFTWWIGSSILFSSILLNAVGAGIFFGLWMAIFFRVRAWQYNIPSWRSFDGTDGRQKSDGAL